MHQEYRFLWPMFWGLFALAIILTRRFTRHRERMRALEVAQKLAEKGVAAPEALSQSLACRERVPPGPESFVLGGGINIAVAAAMVILGVVLSMGHEGRYHGFAAPHPLFGAAAFPALIGLVLLIYGLTVKKKP